MKKGIIAKIVFHVLILGLVFLGAVWGISSYMNRTEVSTSKDMTEASLPLVYMNLSETRVNELHGYTSEMKANFMRDNITPLPNNKVLNVEVIPFQTEVASLSYEIISPLDNSVVEKKRITPLIQEGDAIKVELALENNMRMNQEYILKIIITDTGEQPSYYYTRVIQQERLNANDYLKFVSDFYMKCLDPANQEEIATYLEPDETSDNTTLGVVNIHSDASQLTWGNLAVTLKSSAVPRIKEINETTASLALDYTVSAANADGIVETYYVSEFYRLKYADGQMHLLNFNRTVEQAVNSEANFIGTDGIQIGISSGAVMAESSDDGTMTAFVQAGELWQYNSEADKLTQVFSFSDKADSDLRYSYHQNDIQIVQADDNGDMDFIVYGYMNRGEHEGKVGIAVYHLDSSTNSVEEKIFIPSDEPYELLKKDMGKLIYINDSQTLFFILSNNLYQVELVSREYIVVASNLQEHSYAVDATGKNFAWIEGADGRTDALINVINFDDGGIYTVSGGADESIRPLGFMGGDFVYGAAKQGDISVDALGKSWFPMYKITIGNKEGIVKEYQTDNVYVTETVFQDNLMTLTRVQKEGEEYQEIVEDHIMNNNEKETVTATLSGYTSELKQKVYLISSTATYSGKEPKVVRTKFMIYEQSRDLPIVHQEEEEELYYVYGMGHLDSIYKNVNSAIVRADEIVGVVVNSQLEYIWERGNIQTKVEIDLAEIPEVMKIGTVDVNTITAGVEGTVLNLTGCTLTQIKYFVSAGYPVVVQAGDNVVTLVGYDEWENSILYNPVTEETYFYSSDDSEELFESSGNVFISYLKPLEK